MPMTLADRFWSKVHKTPTCWLWTAYKYPSGYGYFGWSGARSVVAHRAAWELTYGPVPVGLFVLHQCDTRHCVCPTHLFIGTQQDNLNDMKAKGRSPRGSARPNAKLTEERVRALRRRVLAGETIRAVAKEYGVHWTTARQAVHGEKWNHL